MGTVTRAVPHRRAARNAVVVGLLLLTLVAALSLGSRIAGRRWDERCLSGGGAIRVVAASNTNPLVVDSSDPSYECVDGAGAVISRR